MQFSYWESDYYKFEKATIIIGGGITGLSTAISLIEKGWTHPVIIIDRLDPPQGASTKNAGFLCYGSPSELVEDLQTLSYEEVHNLLRMRWTGGQLLQKRLPNLVEKCGGVELLDIDGSVDLHEVNELYHSVTKIKNYAHPITNDQLSSFDKQMIFCPEEGKLNPMNMIDRLKKMAAKLGVIFCHFDVTAIGDGFITVKDSMIPFHHLIICNNGFAKNLIEGISVMAVRNQVILTSPIRTVDLPYVYHYQEGYYYMRKINNRLLIGGARNMDRANETTASFGPNDLIIDHLIDFARSRVVTKERIDIAYQWSGILGVSNDRMPIIKKHESISNCYIGVKLGGMGVAIGSYLGDALSKMIIDNAG